MASAKPPLSWRTDTRVRPLQPATLLLETTATLRRRHHTFVPQPRHPSPVQSICGFIPYCDLRPETRGRGLATRTVQQVPRRGNSCFAPVARVRAGTATLLPSPRSSIAATAHLPPGATPTSSFPLHCEGLPTRPKPQRRPCLAAGRRENCHAGAAPSIALPLTCPDPLL